MYQDSSQQTSELTQWVWSTLNVWNGEDADNMVVILGEQLVDLGTKLTLADDGHT